MVEVDWFSKTEKLAIADVIYVKGLGLCSHQPIFGITKSGEHRVKDIRGYIHIVSTDMLYDTDIRERDLYWSYVHERFDKWLNCR